MVTLPEKGKRARPELKRAQVKGYVLIEWPDDGSDEERTETHFAVYECGDVWMAGPFDGYRDTFGGAHFEAQGRFGWRRAPEGKLPKDAQYIGMYNPPA